MALYRKLNFADTAAPKFDVIFQVLTYQLALNQRFHFPYGFKRAKIQILSVHKGSQVVEQRDPCTDISGDRTRLDQGIAFPVTAMGYKVVIHSIEGQGQWAAVAIGAQSHVGSKDDTRGRGTFQNGDQDLSNLNKKFVVTDAFGAISLATFPVGKHQIHIRGQV